MCFTCSTTRWPTTDDGNQEVTLSILPALDAHDHPVLSFKSVHRLSNATLKDIIKPDGPIATYASQ